MPIIVFQRFVFRLFVIWIRLVLQPALSLSSSSASVLSYLNDVKDASKGRAQCMIEASNVHNLLTNLRFRLEEGQAQAHQAWFNAVQALAVTNGPLDQFKEVLEKLQAVMTDGGRLKNALAWKFKKEEVDDILARMERLKTLTEIALQMDHFKLSQAIKGDVESVQTRVSAIQLSVDKVRHEQVTESQRILLEWISASDYPAQQSDIISRKQEGTGQWFLDAPKVAQWLNEARSTLFCPGIPGAGKTMAAAIAVDQLLDSAQNGVFGVAYVYCNYKSQADQDAASLLAAILKQLGQGRASTLGPIERLHQKHAGRGTKPSLDEIYNSLKEVIAQYTYVHVVIDALDECQSEARRQVIAKLLDLQKSADIRLMATSRFIPDIEHAFEESLRLEVRTSEEDVKRFVAGQIYRLPACIQRSIVLQEMAQEKIVEAVDGMFLLARLHTDSLLDKRTVKDVKSTLNSLSKGAAALDVAYTEALQRIEGQLEGDCRLAKAALTWITFAKRPLTTAEICCALAVEPGEAELDPENKPDIDDIVSVCAGLLVVDQESDIIRLVHYTTQEYFERVSSRLSSDGHLHIARTCLTYLSFSVFESDSCATMEELEMKLSQHDFLNYAASYGGEHAVHVETKVADLICTFLARADLILSAAQALLSVTHFSRKYLSVFTGLHWTARFGLIESAKDFIRTKGEEIRAFNAADSLGHYPLWYAARYSHCEMVKLLLDNGAHIDAETLQIASFQGDEKLAKLLLDNGAHVDAQNGLHGSALEVASSKGHEEIVKLLLDKGADINAQSGSVQGTALCAASSQDHKEIVKLLLDKGADVNAQGAYQEAALHQATYKGHKDVVEILLDRGADINAQKNDFLCTPIDMASFWGHKEITKLLLDRGAHINTLRERFCYTALRAASGKGHQEIVKLLLDKGADINFEGVDGTALQIASLKGRKEVVEILLDRGADFNVKGPDGTALQIASRQGHDQVVKLLRNRGAL